MGSWGYAPFENDQAQDFLYRVSSILEKSMLRYVSAKTPAGRRHKQHDAFAAVEAFCQLKALHTGLCDRSKSGKKGYTFLADLALDTVEALENDEEFVSSWRRPGLFLNVVKLRRRSVLAIVKKARSAEEILKHLFGKKPKSAKKAKRRRAKKA